jgi:hypothetical protein
MHPQTQIHLTHPSVTVILGFKQKRHFSPSPAISMATGRQRLNKNHIFWIGTLCLFLKINFYIKRMKSGLYACFFYFIWRNNINFVRKYFSWQNDPRSLHARFEKG